MKRKCFRIIDELNDESKNKICDNCLENDKCQQAYTHFFAKRICYETWLEIREELKNEDEDTEEYLNEN